MTQQEAKKKMLNYYLKDKQAFLDWLDEEISLKTILEPNIQLKNLWQKNCRNKVEKDCEIDYNNDYKKMYEKNQLWYIKEED